MAVSSAGGVVDGRKVRSAVEDGDVGIENLEVCSV